MEHMITSRKIIFSVGLFFGLAAIGGFLLGFTLWQGDFVAIACCASGITLSCFLWLKFVSHFQPKGAEHLSLLSFVGVSGLALYSNLVWSLWALNVPVNIGTAKSGHMAENYWLGPFTLIYAVLCYVVLTFSHRYKKGDR